MIRIKAEDVSKGSDRPCVKDLKLVWIGNYDSKLDLEYSEALKRVYEHIDRTSRLYSWMWDLKFIWFPMGMYPINHEFEGIQFINNNFS